MCHARVRCVTRVSGVPHAFQVYHTYTRCATNVSKVCHTPVAGVPHTRVGCTTHACRVCHTRVSGVSHTRVGCVTHACRVCHTRVSGVPHTRVECATRVTLLARFLDSPRVDKLSRLPFGEGSLFSCHCPRVESALLRPASKRIRSQYRRVDVGQRMAIVNTIVIYFPVNRRFPRYER